LPLLSQSILLDVSGMIKTLLFPLSLLQVPLPGMSSIHMLTPPLVQEQIDLYFNTLDNYVRSIHFYLPMILFERFLLHVVPLFGHVTLLDETTSWLTMKCYGLVHSYNTH
jgi:hypothetical protein